MWTKSHSIITKEVTKEQIWKLFSDVNNWHTWDQGIEYAKLDGAFETGNTILLRPKGGPEVKINLLQLVPNQLYLDVTRFPLAKMYGEHIFEETPEGLKITITMSVKGILSFLWVKLVAQKIVDDLPTDMLAQVKAAAKFDA
jgi:hypothetical protein